MGPWDGSQIDMASHWRSKRILSGNATILLQTGPFDSAEVLILSAPRKATEGASTLRSSKAVLAALQKYACEPEWLPKRSIGPITAWSTCVAQLSQPAKDIAALRSTNDSGAKPDAIPPNGSQNLNFVFFECSHFRARTTL